MDELPVNSIFQRRASPRVVAIYAGFLVAWAVFLLIIGPSLLFNLYIMIQTAVFLARVLLVYRTQKPAYGNLIGLVLMVLIADIALLWALQPISLD
jgi:hypothetical protein